MNFLLALSCLLTASTYAAEVTPRGQACGRSCLSKITTDYIDALQLKNLTFVSLDPQVRYTDAGIEKKVCTGEVWHMAGAVRLPWRQAIYDATTGSIFFNAIITNQTSNTSTAVAPTANYAYTARLKVEDKAIIEIEEIHHLYDNTTGIFPATMNLAAHTEPDRTWDGIIPEAEQYSADELRRTAYSYWATMNGTYPATGPGAIFGPECQRIEDFSYTTNSVLVAGGCGPGIPHWKMSNARIYIADPVRGVVAGVIDLQSANVKIVVAEWFKIKDGYISQMEAFFDLRGQNSTGWSSFANYTVLEY